MSAPTFTSAAESRAVPADHLVVVADTLATPFGAVPVGPPTAARSVRFSDLAVGPVGSGSAAGSVQLSSRHLDMPWRGSEVRLPSSQPVSFAGLAAPVRPVLPAPRPAAASQRPLIVL